MLSKLLKIFYFANGNYFSLFCIEEKMVYVYIFLLFRLKLGNCVTRQVLLGSTSSRPTIPVSASTILHVGLEALLDLPLTQFVSCFIFAASPVKVTVSNVYKINLNTAVGQTHFISYVINIR